MKKLIKICEYILLILFLILIPFLKNKLAIFISLPILIGFYFLIKNEKIKHFTIFLFIISFIIRIISIIYLKVEIVDDFKTMLEASRNLINGNLSFTKEFYFTAFPYQLGHVLYQALLLKIINSIVFLKIINSIITSLIVVFIYLIGKELVNEKTSRIISLIYLLYFYPVYLNSVLTNQHLPVLLVLISIYILIKKPNKYKYMIIIGLLLGIANILRTESIIFIVGISIYKLLGITKKTKKEVLINTCNLIITYLVFTNLVSILVYISPINKKLTNSYPEWKFYCGLSEKYNGIYNNEDQEVFFNETNKKDLLINRINDEKFKLPVIFLKKETILWTQTNYDLRTQKLNNIFLLFNQGYLNLIIILFVISLIPSKKETDKKILLVKILLALYYGIYLFIEISPRYAYILHILIFLIIGIGLDKILKKLNPQ